MRESRATNAPVGAAAIAAAWGAALELAGCDECDWAALLPPGVADRTCPNCFRSPLAGREEVAYGQPPELALPFAAAPDQIVQGLRDFRASIPFAPADLDPRHLTQRLRRVYVPMWLVDGGVGAIWQAELGYNYDVVSYQDRFSEQAGWESHEVTEPRVRWEPRVGRLSRAYQNIPAPALEGFGLWRERLGDYDQVLGIISPTLERRFQRAQSEHYDLHGAQPYRADLLGNAVVRLPNRAPRDAWYDAARGFRDAAAEECRQAAGADHIREFGWSPQFEQLHWTQLLLPAYTTYYLDDDNAVRRVLVHGQTGRASGPRRASMKRAQRRALLVLAAAFALVAAALVLAAQLAIPSAQIVGNALLPALILAFVVGRLAIMPLVTVSRFNRQQRDEREIVL
jgi:hypothetical protein